MHSFEELSNLFTGKFSEDHFPSQPSSLYEPNRYFLNLGGKRVRPVLCLMGNELFDVIHKDAWNAALAIELFHNFTLIHDDIMDHAPLRRGMQTVHEKYGTSTALLAGDVMLVKAYDYLNMVSPKIASFIIQLFNKTARQVCEGQQLDMDFEKKISVHIDEYLEMISLKTSVLLASSLQMGAIIGGALERNQNLVYEFGRKLGLAFQVQDDFLDAFGDPEKFGKQVGGDILANKKTFLWIHAMEVASSSQKNELVELSQSTAGNKVERVLAIYDDCKVKEWARDLKTKFMDEAFTHLEDVAVISKRKEPLKSLANYLVQRES
jgi:geranylgeranyl diphosphate synthase, type II